MPMKNNTDEICEKLQSTDRHSKIATLEELQRQCENREISTDEIKNTFDECYLHLLKCYADRYESVRDNSVQTVTQFIRRLPPIDFHSLNVIATLAVRMGQQKTVEESEEIRLLYVQQLHTLVQQYVGTRSVGRLHECYEDIVRILVKALADAYPAVQREACACLSTLACNVDTCSFQPWTELLAKSLYGMLNHKHSMARIAAIGALSRIALHFNASGEALSRLIMEVSPLLMDSMPLVRLECGKFGVLMLLELKDRYSYFERIIPLVLCCLKDDAPDVVEYIRPLWLKCGRLYYEENEAELSKQEIADVQPANYPSDVERPTIGCRGLVQRSLRLLTLITRESGDWKDNVRLHSLKLLYQFVLHAEAAMTAKFFEIYPDVARSCRDSETSVAKEAMKVSDLMGRLLKYSDWFEHAIDGLSKNARVGYLKCFYTMFTSTMDAQLCDILRIAKLLTTIEFSHTLKPDFQLYVIQLVETLLNHSEVLKEKEISHEKVEQDSYAELDKNLYITTIKVMALSLGTDKLQALGSEILRRLSERRKITESILHENYFALALNDVQNLDAPLDDRSEPILLLHGLLSVGKFRSSYMPQLQKLINLVWEFSADDAKVKIFSAISIAMLNWTETVNRDIEESTELLEQFLISVVEPHLLWRAGANAEAMRSLATATLCSMSQGAAVEARLVLPKLCCKYMPSLLEDQAIATRHYAVKTMLNFGEVKVEDLRLTAYATLQRLDDPSADIRELAVRAIAKLCPKFEKAKGEKDDCEHDVWETFIRKAVDMMFLHYDGPEKRLQKAIKESISQIIKKYPDHCKYSYNRTLAMSYNSCCNLKELQNAFPQLSTEKL